MSTIKLSSMMFRLWVRLQDRPLTFRELLALRRECRRFACESLLQAAGGDEGSGLGRAVRPPRLSPNAGLIARG